MVKKKDKMKYIIMCGGDYVKWETPRHLSIICGEEIVARTIRLLRENGIKDIAISELNLILSFEFTTNLFMFLALIKTHIIPNNPNVSTNSATKEPKSLKRKFGSSGSLNKDSQNGHLYALGSIIFPQNGQFIFSLI